MPPTNVDANPTEGDSAELFERAADEEGPAVEREAARVLSAVESRLFGNTVEAAKVGRFTLLEQIGSGGAGMVWAAYDPRLDRKVALKLLRMRADRSSPGKARLIREAQVAGRLSHPNIVSVFDVGEYEGSAYITMEFIDGPDLARWLDDDERNKDVVRDVFVQAGRGLAEAHRNGVVHRDFKPANVMVQLGGAEPRARVVDFGLAGWDDASSSHHDASIADALDSGSLTATGRRIGTPAYMSPEQAEGQRATERSDQFSFCVSLVEGLTGRRPFDAVDGCRRMPSLACPLGCRAHSSEALRETPMLDGRRWTPCSPSSSLHPVRADAGPCSWEHWVCSASRSSSCKTPPQKPTQCARERAKSCSASGTTRQKTVSGPQWSTAASPTHLMFGNASRRASTVGRSVGPACIARHARPPTFVGFSRRRPSTSACCVCSGPSSTSRQRLRCSAIRPRRSSRTHTSWWRACLRSNHVPISKACSGATFTSTGQTPSAFSRCSASSRKPRPTKKRRCSTLRWPPSSGPSKPRPASPRRPSPPRSGWSRRRSGRPAASTRKRSSSCGRCMPMPPSISNGSRFGMPPTC